MSEAMEMTNYYVNKIYSDKTSQKEAKNFIRDTKNL